MIGIQGKECHCVRASLGSTDVQVQVQAKELVVNRLLDQILGLRLTDSFCGFKAHRVAAMRALSLDEPGYAFPLQFWAQCVRAGLRIRELPVRRIYRDTSREFGGTLDDPAARLLHYLAVFVRELERCPLRSRRLSTAPLSEHTLTVCRCPQHD